MWVRTTDGLDLFIKTADEGIYTWEFDGENYTIHKGKDPSPVHRVNRYSLSMLAIQKSMPTLFEARQRWLNRKMS
jgi:hypothetical protein